MPVILRMPTTPTSDIGTAARITNGSVMLSYCTDSTTNTRKIASPTTSNICALLSSIASASPPMITP